MAAHGKISVSEVARLYGKDRKLVYNLIKEHGIGVEKQQKPKRTLVRLTDIIQYWSEPENLVTPTVTRRSMGGSREFTPDITPIFEQQISDLRKRVEELVKERDREREEYQEREEYLRHEKGELLSIVKQQGLLLEDKREREKPEEQGQKSSDRLLVYGLAIAVSLVTTATAYILFKLWAMSQ